MRPVRMATDHRLGGRASSGFGFSTIPVPAGSTLFFSVLTMPYWRVSSSYVHHAQHRAA